MSEASSTLLAVSIRERHDLGPERSRFDAGSAAETIAELDAQYAAGEIDRHAYLVKKQSLVRLFLKATTSPTRRPPRWETEL